MLVVKMNCNYIKLYILLLTTVKANGMKSLTLVLDTTISMRDEIDILKTSMGRIILNSNLSDIENYILVPYDDPGFGPPIISRTPDRLIDLLNAVEVGGGSECPENAMPAIEQALSVSNPNSYIFVFTDGFPKDNIKMRSIENLCHTSRSQVVIFLSGKCVPTNKMDAVGDIDGYYDIANSCSGTVLRFELFNLRQAFKIIRELTKTDYTEIDAHKQLLGPKILGFSVDSYTKDVLIAVSGEYSSLLITDGYGRNAPIENILHTRQSEVAKILKPETGDYKVEIMCQGSTIITIYRKKEIEFQYGFSPKFPKSIKETSPLPIPGSTSYICIAVTEISIQLNSIHIRFDSSTVKEIDVEVVNANKGLYVARQYFEPRKSFKITFYGHDATSQIIKGSTGTLRPQTQVLTAEHAKPRIMMIEPEVALVNYNSTLEIACKVIGYPKPNMLWSDDSGTELQSEDALLEIPSIYISYARIEKVTKNATISCKGENSEGEDSLSMNIYVNRTFSFDVIQYPQDSSIEYGTEGRLFCQVEAYPDATIEWYHNDTLVEESDNINIDAAENMLLIKNVTLDDGGEYRCDIRNEFKEKSFKALIDVSGLEAARVEIKDIERVMTPGDWLSVECLVTKGKPSPTVTWTYKPEEADDFTDIPNGVSAEDNLLKIPSVTIEHTGVYKCEAANIVGEDSQTLIIKVQYAPKIKVSEELKTVKEGDYVEIACDVDAVPKARVRWELTKDDIIIAWDSRHNSDEWNTHKFIVFANDSGNYHCIAENIVGRAVRTVTLNVLVKPYIEPLPTKTMNLRTGETLKIPCQVSYGNPVPSIKWELISPNSTTTILFRGKSSKDLAINKVSRKDEGSYICVAENEAGYDSIKLIVKVI